MWGCNSLSHRLDPAEGQHKAPREQSAGLEIKALMQAVCHGSQQLQRVLHHPCALEVQGSLEDKIRRTKSGKSQLVT